MECKITIRGVFTARIKRNLKNGKYARWHRNATQVAIVMKMEKNWFRE